VRAVPDESVVARVRAGDVDALTFTSSSTVTNLCDLLGDLPAPQPVVASIGPVTSKTALERGLRVDVEAGEHTIDGLVDALLRTLSSDGA
jgi:uroporphyrinogen III methyltransferase / synthase